MNIAEINNHYNPASQSGRMYKVKNVSKLVSEKQYRPAKDTTSIDEFFTAISDLFKDIGKMFSQLFKDVNYNDEIKYKGRHQADPIVRPKYKPEVRFEDEDIFQTNTKPEITPQNRIVSEPSFETKAAPAANAKIFTDDSEKAAPEVSLLAEYRALTSQLGAYPESGTDEEKAQWSAINEKRQKLLQEITAKNISMVELRDFTPAEENEKRLYLRKIKSLAVYNTASQYDCIKMYEKYCGRYWVDNVSAQCSLVDLTTVCSPLENSNKKYVLGKYADIMLKIGRRDNTDMRDATKVTYMIEKYGKYMDEELAIKYIELLKKVSFQRSDEALIRMYLPRAVAENPAVKAALAELRDELKDFPEVDYTLRF